MRHQRRWKTPFALVLLLTLIIPILAACGGPAGTTPGTSGGANTPEATQASSGVTPETTPDSPAPTETGGGQTDDTSKFLVFGNPGEPDSLDSMDTTSGQSLVVTEQIEEPLVGRTTGPDLVGYLAEEWSNNEDSTEWTFKLRQGVKFHDGTDFNADAVVFNFLRMGDPNFEHGYRDQGKTYSAFNDIFGGFIGSDTTAFKSIEKVDDYTVKMTMTRSFPLLPNVLSSSYFGISSPAAVQKHGAQYGTPESVPVGTGPFKFESWTPGQNIVLVRNDDYWGEKAKMPGAVVRFIPDAPARLAELQAGSIDFTVNLPPDSRETLANDANLQEVPVEPFNIAYIAMNLNDKPFDDPRVRQAVALAIDKQEILDAFYGGVGEVADTFLPATMSWARPQNVQKSTRDVERAKQLLAEAGYPEGISTVTLTDGTELPLEFWYMPVSRPYYPTPKPIAEAFAAQLAEAGINVELKTEDWGVYLDNVDAGKKHGMWMLGWTGDYADPNNFLYVFFGPTAATQRGYDNPQLVELLQRAGAARTQEESAALFAQAGQIVQEDMSLVPVVHSPPVYGARKAVTGWEPTPFGHEPWVTISVEK